MFLIDKIKSLLLHAGFKKYFFNTGWLMLDKVARLFLGLFVGVWVARYLGPSNYGVLSFALSFVGLFGAFSKLGLDGIVVRNIVREPAERDEILGTSLILKIIGSFILLISVYSALQFIRTTPREKIIVMIIAFGQLFMNFEVIDFYFQSQVKAKYSGITGICGLIVSSIARIIFILLKLPLVWFAIVVVVEQFVKAVFFVLFYIKNKLNIFEWKFSFKMAKALLRDSWPLILSGSVLMIQARIDQVMIKEFLGNREVGYYSIAMKLIEVFGFIPMVLKSSLYPAIQKAKNMSEVLYQKRLLDYYRLSFLLFLLIAIPIFLFANKIVVVLFGVGYQPAGILLSLMAIRLFFTNMGVARGCFILTENLLKFSMITMTVGTITNVGLNYIWIPIYGAKGAILATIFSFAITIFFIDVFYPKTRGNVLLQFKAILTFYKLKCVVE